MAQRTSRIAIGLLALSRAFDNTEVRDVRALTAAAAFNFDILSSCHGVYVLGAPSVDVASGAILRVYIAASSRTLCSEARVLDVKLQPVRSS